MDLLFGGIATWFGITLIVFVLLFVAAVVFIVVVVVRNASKAKSMGYDPLTMETEMAARAMQSPLLTPAKTLEQRLAELDDLKARGVITADEHAAARQKALDGL